MSGVCAAPGPRVRSRRAGSMSGGGCCASTRSPEDSIRQFTLRLPSPEAQASRLSPGPCGPPRGHPRERPCRPSPAAPPRPCWSPRPALTAAPPGAKACPRWPITGSPETFTAVGQGQCQSRDGSDADQNPASHTCVHTHTHQCAHVHRLHHCRAHSYRGTHMHPQHALTCKCTHAHM